MEIFGTIRKNGFPDKRSIDGCHFKSRKIKDIIMPAVNSSATARRVLLELQDAVITSASFLKVAHKMDW
jgi:hypothetical protein